MDASRATAPDIRRLDFSLFHPQDHLAWDSRCRTLPGGGRRHLRDWWDYRFEYRPDQIAGRLACRLLKRHDYRESWHAHRATPTQRAGLERRPMFYDGRSCWWCYKKDPDLLDVPDVCPDHESQRAAEAAHWAAIAAAGHPVEWS